MHADPSYAVLGLSFWVIPWRKDQGAPITESVIAGHRVWTHAGIEMFNVAAFNMAFISKIGGFSQPYGYYGGIESYLHSKWAPMGMKFGYLADITSAFVKLDQNDRRIFDPEYRQWKDAHLGGFQGSFEEWLRIHAPEILK